MQLSRKFFGLGAVLLALPIMAAVEQGSVAPDFSARASLAGEEFDFSLQAALESGPVVVYFYPSAYTAGCNIQARQFATQMAEFEAAGASVIGVSLDSIERLNAFSADPEYCAGELAVASDESGAIAASYGVGVTESDGSNKDTRGVAITHGFADRTTFIVAATGKVAAVITGVAPSENVRQSLEVIQGLD